MKILVENTTENPTGSSGIEFRDLVLNRVNLISWSYFGAISPTRGSSLQCMEFEDIVLNKSIKFIQGWKFISL